MERVVFANAGSKLESKLERRLVVYVCLSNLQIRVLLRVKIAPLKYHQFNRKMFHMQAAELNKVLYMYMIVERKGNGLKKKSRFTVGTW